MTRDEAIKILDTIPTIGEQVDALEIAIRSLEAWDKIKNDLDDLWLKGYSPHTEVMEIIDRHLSEVEDDEK